MSAEDYRTNSRRAAQGQRFRKRMLAVRAMAGETAWLDGLLHWQGDRVVWNNGGTTKAPGPADVAMAQRRLGQIERYRRAARQTLGDLADWLERRGESLEIAKFLAPLRAPRIDELARRAQGQDPAAIEQLTHLLAAEALCVNDLPISPAAALAGCGEPAARRLAEAIADEAMPEAGRALAALVLGAIRRRAGDPDSRGAPGITIPSAWLQRLYTWGLEHGVPDAPGLLVALLRDAGGLRLAERIMRATAAGSPFLPDNGTLRELLSKAASVESVVNIVEAAAAARPLAERILDYRDALPPLPDSPRKWIRQEMRRERQEAAEQLSRERGELVNGLREVISEYIRATVDAAVVGHIAGFAGTMLDRGGVNAAVIQAATHTLAGGLVLPADLQVEFVRLLGAYDEAIWSTDGMAKALSWQDPGVWFEGERVRNVGALITLLINSRDADVAEAALKAGIYVELGSESWVDPSAYRASVSFVRDLGLGSVPNLVRQMIGSGDVNAWRQPLHDLRDALTAVAKERRKHILESVSDYSPHRREELQRLLRLRLRLIRWMARMSHDLSGYTCGCEVFASGGEALERFGLAGEDPWIETLFSFLQELERKEGLDHGDFWSLRTWVWLAAAVADGDLARYRRILRAGGRRQIGYLWGEPAAVAGVLLRYPALRRPLAQLLPRQTDRCLRLLRQISLAARLGDETLAPLRVFEDKRSPVALEDEDTAGEWAGVAALGEDLAALSRAYLDARRLVGSDVALPPGVRQALRMPEKLARELEHLEKLLATRGHPGHLARRAENLRARLAGEEGLRGAVTAEVREHLEQAAAEAQLAAAEWQAIACYRGRLELVAGPLPAKLQLDENLLNATLLTVDISRNRRLLLRLLRAYLAGDTTWPHRHPANLAFLRSLADRGVDTRAWLGAGPRVYRTDRVPGGRVRLFLERDPLAILQMGNYFDTCLSFDGANSFSTVANACELNKRVIYAADGRGRIVGRKLIGIREDGALIGFRTYTALESRDANTALRDIFARYVTAFAGRCGLPMAEEGTVPRLFAEAWYDDGVAPWNDDSAPPASKRAADARAL